MGNEVIRSAEPTEQKQLEDLQRRASLNNPGDREVLLAHPDAIELPLEQIVTGGVFVSESAGAITGFAAILPRSDGDTDLDGLFVDPVMQRRGIGRALVEHCAGAARSRGSSALYVIGNPHAEHFYLSCGFNIIGTSETQFGTGLLMRLSLVTSDGRPVSR